MCEWKCPPSSPPNMYTSSWYVTSECLYLGQDGAGQRGRRRRRCRQTIRRQRASTRTRTISTRPTHKKHKTALLTHSPTNQHTQPNSQQDPSLYASVLFSILFFHHLFCYCLGVFCLLSVCLLIDFAVCESFLIFMCAVYRLSVAVCRLFGLRCQTINLTQSHWRPGGTAVGPWSAGGRRAGAARR